MASIERLLERQHAALLGSLERAVAELAADLRCSLAQQAYQALRALGEPADRVSPAEAELRTHIHDALHVSHDKDFRVMACLPSPQLRHHTLVVLRVNYVGALVVETVTGEDATEANSRDAAMLFSRHCLRS